MTGRWPWPEDTRTDVAQRCARRYRDELLQVAPDVCAALDRQYIGDWGQGWLDAKPAVHERDDAVTVDVAAEYVGLTAHAVYKWIERNKINAVQGNDGRVRVVLGHAIDLVAESRRRRAGYARRTAQK